MANPLLRYLRGSNLEIFKFGMYLAFPIGWMYYFGTNLDRKFSIPDFWPTQEQSHKIPTEKDDIRKEVERIRMEIRERKRVREQEGDAVGEDGRRVLQMGGQGPDQVSVEGQGLQRILERGEERRGGIRASGNALGVKSESGS